MRPPAGRGFRLLDAMILMAAIAVGFALARMGAARVLGYETGPFSPAARWPLRAWLVVLAAVPHVAPIAPALLCIGLLPPRPDLRRLASRPGFVACLALTIVLVVRAAGFLALWARTLGSPFARVRREVTLLPDPFRILDGAPGLGSAIEIPTFRALIHLAPLAAELGLSVAVAWSVLAIGRRWRPEPSWVDRSGRVVVGFWLTTLPLTSWWSYHIMY
jgi:hypothetical protein